MLHEFPHDRGHLIFKILKRHFQKYITYVHVFKTYFLIIKVIYLKKKQIKKTPATTYVDKIKCLSWWFSTLSCTRENFKY